MDRGEYNIFNVMFKGDMESKHAAQCMFIKRHTEILWGGGTFILL